MTRVPAGVEVLCIGETMVLVAPAEPGRLDANTPMLLRPAGAESNVAVHLAALGHRVSWAGQLGKDPLGELILDDLRARDVDTSLTRRDETAPTGVLFKDPAPDGTTVYYYRSGSAASRMSRSCAAEWAEAHADVVHLSGITAALSAPCLDLMRHLIHDRPLRGKLSFDVNHRPRLSSVGTPDLLLELAQNSDIVFVGRDEAEALWGTSTAEAIRGLLDKPEHLIVKDADREAVDFFRAEVVRVPSARVTVVDAVGAGDAFAAGWLSAYLQNLPAAERLASGHTVAAGVLTSTTDYADSNSSQNVATAVGHARLDLHDH